MGTAGPASAALVECGSYRLAVSENTTETSGTEQNDCHCESSSPFMGRIKVNGKPYCSSSPLSKRNAVKRQRKREEPRMQQDCACGSPDQPMEAEWKQVARSRTRLLIRKAISVWTSPMPSHLRA